MNRRTLGAMIFDRSFLDELWLGWVRWSYLPLGTGSIFHPAQMAGRLGDSVVNSTKAVHGTPRARPLSSGVTCARRLCLTGALVLILIPAVASSQSRGQSSVLQARPDSAGVTHTFPAVFLPAVLGAAVGSVAGFKFGNHLDWGGGDDPGLGSALLFGALGGGAGSVLFAGPLIHRRVETGRAVKATVLGALAGAVAVALVGNADDRNLTIASYSLAQGMVTAGILAAGR